MAFVFEPTTATKIRGKISQNKALLTLPNLTEKQRQMIESTLRGWEKSLKEMEEQEKKG